MKKVLIFAPHQDDELILCGGFLKEMSEMHDVYIVFMTNGDYEVAMRTTRLRESLNVGKLYGINKENIIFLGYANEYDIKGPHIYNAKENEIVMSQYGNSITYGLETHPEYCYLREKEHHDYSRNNLRQDLKNVLLDILPDIIFATDAEIHPDHKANSLFLDEVLGEILKEKNDYTPIVLKKPGYMTSWFSENDYAIINNESTKFSQSCVRVNGHRALFSNPYLKWNERIRLPIGKSVRESDKNKNVLYKALKEYRSQNAVNHYEMMLNSDVVFWQRRTDSLTYGANVEVTSGTAEYLNDFKVVDCSSIKRKPTESWRIDQSIWRPSLDDRHPRIDFILNRSESISEMVFYQEYYPESRIVRCHVIFDDIEEIEIGELRINGVTCVEFTPIKAKIVSFVIDEVSNPDIAPGITEIEIFKEKEDKLLFSKIMIQDNFVYNYHLKNRFSMPVSVYEYYENGISKKTSLKDYIVKTDNLEIRNNYIHISDNRISGNITKSVVMEIIHKDFPNIKDSIRLIPDISDKINFHALLEGCISGSNGIYSGKLSDKIASLSYGEQRENMGEYVKEFIRGYICDDYRKKNRTQKKVFFIGTPDHCNIGDHAITVATYKVLRAVLGDIDIEEIAIMDFARKLPYLLHNIRPDDLIILQGGGNMGNIYWRNERIRREVITHFPKNMKIIFPETIYYDKTTDGRKDFELSKRVYKNSNTIIFAREQKSYEIMKEAYPWSKIFLVPDIVCYLAPYDVCEKREKVGLCFRNDLEKSVSNSECKRIYEAIAMRGEKADLFDMMYPSNWKVGKSSRKKIVEKKIRELASYKYVITDRLHGMILCFITGTPCVAISKYNHKIQSFYDTWFKDVSYIRCLNSSDNVEHEISYLNSLENGNPNKMNFEELTKILEDWK